MKSNERTQKQSGVKKYLPMSQLLSKSHFREDFKSQSLDDCNEITVSVLVQVLNEKILEQPVFVIYLQKSQASSTFLLRLPLLFSRRYLPMHNLLMTLETESGKLYETKYLSEHGLLSAGWKRFAITEKLVKGDHVVFHLVDVTRFKVYIIKKGSSTVKLPTHLLNLCKIARQCGANDNQLILYKRREMHQLVYTFNKTYGGEQCGKTGEINESTRFDDFKIKISTLLQDHKMSEHSLDAYYELCQAQNAFLHAQLLKGINPKLLVEANRSTISNTIRIATALRTCSLSTFLDNFPEWKKSLKHYEALGMNVGLLSARLDHLSNLTVTSDGAVSRDRYIEACRERPRCECAVKKLDMILAKLRKFLVMLDSKVKVLESEAGWEKYTEAYFSLTQVKDEIREIEGLIADFGKFFEYYDAVIESLKSKLSSHEHRFQEEAGAPW